MCSKCHSDYLFQQLPQDKKYDESYWLEKLTQLYTQKYFLKSYEQKNKLEKTINIHEQRKLFLYESEDMDYFEKYFENLNIFRILHVD